MALNFKNPQIKNSNYPVCFNCAHFIKYQKSDTYDPYNDQEYGLCKKFGKMNLVSGQVKHDFASQCRDDDKRCGEKGDLYEDASKK
jgi:hypothetical protein